MSDIDCPYCGHGQEVCHDDGESYAEDELHQMECYECEKYFTFYTSISFSYDAHQANCLNDGEHDFKPTITAPIEFTKMRCSECDERRKPTDSEMKAILEDSI